MRDALALSQTLDEGGRRKRKGEGVKKGGGYLLCDFDFTLSLFSLFSAVWFIEAALLYDVCWGRGEQVRAPFILQFQCQPHLTYCGAMPGNGEIQVMLWHLQIQLRWAKTHNTNETVQGVML